MEIDIPEGTSEKIAKASKELGIDEEELVDRAVLLFLDNVNTYLELKEEFKNWNELSDEALVKFEQKI